jgi:hypothetical protein
MSCLTVLRLGQIIASKRPAYELTEALKGKIVYQPVDVQANTNVQPDELLNIDSFVILFKGQPTHNLFRAHEVPEGAILEKLANDAKSHLVMNFSMKPLNSSVPKDFIDDFKNNKNIENDQFQLKRLHGLGENIY